MTGYQLSYKARCKGELESFNSLTISDAGLHRADLLRMQASHFICHLAIPDVPKPESAVKVARTDDVLVSGAAHRVAAAVAHDGAQAVALVQVPHLDGPVCAAADSPQGGAGTAIHTAHLQHNRADLISPAEEHDFCRLNYLPHVSW